MKGWREQDKKVFGDDGFDDMWKEHGIKQQAQHDEENSQMAEMAQQTIKTLTDMLDQKKTQLKSKEDQIKKLRKEMWEQREIDANKYMKLQSDTTSGRAQVLANLERMVDK